MPGALLLASAVGLALVGCTCGEETAAEGPRAAPATARPNVLLVTLDTTRADRLGCYGFGLAGTDAIDQLAAEGVRASRALASAPVTAPSHASMLTGLHPPAHGVRDNGVHRLADEVETLPEVLGRAGYATAAFVSAAVLQRRYNLSQGFETYDDDLWSEDAPAMFFIRERPGARTVDRAVAWLEEWGEESERPPFFAWVHLFDAHQPHTPEPRDRLLAPTPYDAELRGVDRQVGRLRAALEALGVLEDTIVIVTADHGESLGEHGERTHAVFVYESTIRVPLIVRYPRGLGAPRVYDAPIRHVDLAPTLYAMLGVEGGPVTQGRDLSEALAGRTPGPALEAYSESLVSQIGFGMAPLHALRDPRYTYIRAPRRELYDRASDPGEVTDLAASEAVRADALDAALEALLTESLALAPEASEAPLDDETLEQLRALGYVGDAATSAALAGMDPKDGLVIHENVQRVRELIRNGRCERAAPLLDEVLAATPTNLTALSLSALCLDRRGLHEEARATYLRALELAPAEPRLHLALALSELGGGGSEQVDDAERHLRAALEASPDFVEAWVALGLVSVARGDMDGAEPSFARALAIDPDFPRGLAAAADLSFRRGDFAAALAGYRRALEVRSDAFEVLNQAAAAARRLGEREAALGYLDRAETVRPDSFIPPYNRACLFALEGDRAAALAALQVAVERGMPSPADILADPDLRAFAADPDFLRLAAMAPRSEER